MRFDGPIKTGKREKGVQPARPARAARTTRAGSAQWGTASLFAIPLFVVAYLAAAVLWRVPGWVAGAGRRLLGA